MLPLKKGWIVLTRSRVLKSGIWYLFSDFLLSGMAFLTIPIFTRLLTVEEYGLVSVYMSVVGIMTIISGASLANGIGRARFDFADSYLEYKSSVLFLSALIFLGVFLAVFLFSKQLSSAISIPSRLVLYAALAGYASFVVGFLKHDLLFRQKYKQRAFLSIVGSLSQIALSIVLVLSLAENLYMGKVFGSLIPSTILALLVFVHIFGPGRRIIYPEAWRFALLFALPLIPHSLSHIILAQFDRIAVQAIVGSAETGLYSFAYNIGMITQVLLGASNAAWVPWFYKKMSKEEFGKIREATRAYSIIFLTATVVIMTLGPEMGLAMAPGQYLLGLRLVPVIALGDFFRFLYVVYVNFAFYKKKTIAISIGTIMAGVLNVVLNLSLIPVFGYEAAAWTTAISYFCLFIFHWFNVTKLLKDKTIPLKGMMILAGIAAAVACQQYFVSFFVSPFSLAERLMRFGISTTICALLAAYALRRIKGFLQSKMGREGE